MKPLFLLLFSAVSAACISKYEPTDWYGWELFDSPQCLNFRIDANYNCAWLGVGLPTDKPSEPYLHLGNADSCNLPGPCLAPTSDGTTVSTKSPYGRSPVLDFGLASNCIVKFEMSQAQTRGFAPPFYQYVLTGISGNLPSTAASWTVFSAPYDGTPQAKFIYWNGNGGYDTALTLLSIRRFSITCNGLIGGPNVTSTGCESFPTERSTAVPFWLWETIYAPPPTPTAPRNYNGYYPLPPPVSAASLLDCHGVLVMLCGAWLLASTNLPNTTLYSLVQGCFLLLLLTKLSQMTKQHFEPR